MPQNSISFYTVIRLVEGKQTTKVMVSTLQGKHSAALSRVLNSLLSAGMVGVIPGDEAQICAFVDITFAG